MCPRMNGAIIDLFDLQNDLGSQSCKSKLFLEKVVEQMVSELMRLVKSSLSVP